MRHQQNLSSDDEKVKLAYEKLRALATARNVTSKTLTSSNAPAKRRTKLRTAITKGSPAYYGGHPQFGAVQWSTATMIRMIAAKNGCTREATETEESRLGMSSRNA